MLFCALHKPAMLVGGVVRHQVDDQPHVPLLDARQHRVEVGHGPELRHHLAIVADVVAIVRVGRVEVRAQPDDVHAQLLQVVQPRRDSLQIADAIAVRVLKRSRIDLVDHRLLPPLRLIAVDQLWTSGLRRCACAIAHGVTAAVPTISQEPSAASSRTRCFIDGHPGEPKDFFNPPSVSPTQRLHRSFRRSPHLKVEVHLQVHLAVAGLVAKRQRLRLPKQRRGQRPHRLRQVSCG